MRSTLSMSRYIGQKNYALHNTVTLISLLIVLNYSSDNLVVIYYMQRKV